MREDHAKRISLRARLFKQQNGVCGYCKRKITGKPSLDHIIPLNHMDENLEHPENYIVTCIACNKRKGDSIIFSNLFDKEVYPIVDIPYFFRSSEIQYNYKDRK